MKNRTTTVTTGPKKNRATTKTTMYQPINSRGMREGAEGGMQEVAQNRTTKETTYKPINLPSLANKFPQVTLDEYKRIKGAQEGMGEVAQNFVNERLNSIPFRNSSINVFDKKRYDISREFDGQEVPGSLTVRPTLSGGTVETERFDIPGAGTSTSRVRKNAEGQTVRRVVKDKNINK